MSHIFKSNGKDLKVEVDGRWKNLPNTGPGILRYENVTKIEYNQDEGIMYFVAEEPTEKELEDVQTA